MPIVDANIALGFYEDSSRPIAAMRCVNWLPTYPSTAALSAGQLKPAPGISLVANAGSAGNRGSHVINGEPFFVNGDRLISVSSADLVIDRGPITGVGRVFMADNGAQLIIVVPGVTGYIFDALIGTLTEITDPAYFELGPSEHVAYKDGFFVHISRSLFYISALNDGLSYNALDFGTAEVDPDDNVAIHVNRNVLYIAGNETIEAFQNVGGADFPFSRIPGAIIQKGVLARASVVEFSGSFVFLGGGLNERPSVWLFNGSNTIKIATEAVDNAIAMQPRGSLTSVFANTYSLLGGFFVCFQFFDRTLCYDTTASAKAGYPIWHERRSGSIPWRVSSITNAAGRLLVGDTTTDNIGELTDSVFTEYGDIVDRDISTMPLYAGGSNFFVNSAELVTESGVGLTLPPSDNPLVTMSYSVDGGNTFSNTLPRALGRVGEYEQRQIWRRIGRVARYIMFRFSISDPVGTAIIKLELDIDNGTQ